MNPRASTTARIALCTLILTLEMDAFGEVPPEIPDKRTAQVFSPVAWHVGQVGRSVFLGGGPHDLGYDIPPENQCIVATPPQTPTAIPGCGLIELKSFLQSRAGVLHIETHSTRTSGERFAVEVYRADSSAVGSPCEFAESWFEAYTDASNGVIDPVEAELVQVGADFCVIRVNSHFVRQRASAIHGIVHGMFCHSADQGADWVSGIGIRNFVGYVDSVPAETDSVIFPDALFRTQLVFDNMAGTRDELGSFGNHSVSASVEAANDAIGFGIPRPVKLYSNSLPSDASGMRIYNSPRLVFADLRADSNGDGDYERQIYRYIFGRDQYPYVFDSAGNRADYPNGGERSHPEQYSNGPLEVILRFSEPMDTSPEKIVVELLLPNNAAPVPVLAAGGTNGWTSKNMPNNSLFDTWTGRVSISGPIPSGEARIRMRAVHKKVGAGLDIRNQGLDLDGDGTSFPPTALDTSVSFIIGSGSPPRVSVHSGGTTLFLDAVGAPSIIPGTLSDSAFVVLENMSGVTSISHNGATLPIVSSFTLTNLSGNNTLTVTNAAGSTTLKWVVTSLAISVNSVEAQFSADPLKTRMTLDVRALSSDGVSAFERRLLGAPDEVFRAPGSQFLITEDVPVGGAGHDFLLRNNTGRSALNLVGVAIENLPLPPPAVGGAVVVAERTQTTSVSVIPAQTTSTASGHLVRFAPQGAILLGPREDGRHSSLRVSRQFGEINETERPVQPNASAGRYELKIGGTLISSGTVPVNLEPGNIALAPRMVTGESLEITVVSDAVDGAFLCLEQAGSTCRRWAPVWPKVEFGPAIVGLGYTQIITTSNAAVVYPGEGQTIMLGGGVKLSGVKVAGGVQVANLVSGRSIEPGWTSALSGNVHDIHLRDFGENRAIVGTFTVHIDYDPLSLPEAQRAGVTIVRLDRCGLTALPGQAGAGQASASVGGLGRFTVVSSEFANRQTKTQGRCSLSSNDPSVVATEGVGTEGHAQALDVFASLGLKAETVTCDFSPTGTSFEPQAVVKLCLPDENARFADSFSLYQFNDEGLQERIPDLYTDRELGFVAGRVGALSSRFNVFSTTTPVPARDLLSPVAQLLVGTTTVGSFGVFPITEAVSIIAADRTFPGAPTSGVGSIRYGVDEAFVDFETTPGLVFSEPFTLTAGSHTLFYYAVDNAGNRSPVGHAGVLIYEAAPPPAENGTGMALGSQAGALWLVRRTDAQEFFLSKHGADGALMAQERLPGATDSSDWSVSFDSAGHVYAVGSSSRPSGSVDLALYKASSAGVLLSTAGYSTGADFNDFALDASSDVWISGGVQDAQGQIRMALWHYCPHSGRLTKKAEYARGHGFDAAWGVATAGSSVWAAGYSQNAAGTLDLALWRFDANSALVGASVFVADYAPAFDPALKAAVAATDDAVFIAAARIAAGDTDLAFLKIATDGQVLSERVWRGPPGRVEQASAMLRRGQELLVSGIVEGGGAVWSYDEAGTLVAARTQAGLSAVRDLAALDESLWLAVDGSSVPVRFVGAQALAGDDVLVSSKAPLSLFSVQPSSGRNDEVVAVAVEGAGFKPGAALALARADLRILASTVSVQSGTRLTAALDLTGQATGQWSLVVANPDGRSATLADAFTILGAPPLDAFTARLDPEALNLKSEGKHVTLTLTSGAKAVSQIAAASLRILRINDALLTPEIPALDKPKPELSGDELSVKFDRQALAALLPAGEQARVLLTGRLADGSPFEASALIRTIHSVKAPKDKPSVAAHPTSGAMVSLPAGSVNADLDVTVVKVAAQPREEAEAQKRAADASGLKAHGAVYDFGPEGTQFTQPVALTLPYDPAAVSDPMRLKIGYWNPARSAWEELESAVDTQRRVVTAQTSHFSQYQVIAPASAAAAPAPAPAPSAAEDAFVLRELFAFPNPARDRVTIRLRAGRLDSMQVNVYDVTGRRVHGGSTSGAALVDGQWTSDFVWETGAVGSGVYYFTVTAKKSGHGDIRKVGKVGVIK